MARGKEDISAWYFAAGDPVKQHGLKHGKYLKAGHNTVDGNRRCLNVVGDVHKIGREVFVVDLVDGHDGRGFAAAGNVLVDDTLRPTTVRT